MLHIRVDDDTKEQVTQALTAMGLSMSDAVRLFLRRVVIDQAFPLELKVPTAQTRAGSVALPADERSFGRNECQFIKLDGFSLPMHKTGLQKTSLCSPAA
nr:type II toxin-antitoxin system RelB/DinJ family antitoxin [Polaromonas sp. E3S]